MTKLSSLLPSRERGDGKYTQLILSNKRKETKAFVVNVAAML